MTEQPRSIDTQCPLLLGIDCGTESIRVLAVDCLGAVYGAARSSHRTAHLSPGRAEQTPSDWWEGLTRAVQELASAGIDLHRVAAIGIAATSSTVVFATDDGQPTRTALLWMDVRAISEARAFEVTGHPVLGVCPDGVSPEWGPAKAAWVRGHEPEIYARSHVICEGGDWLIHQLTGEWTANIPAASTAWFYDAAGHTWPADLYEAAGLPDLIERCPKRVLRSGEVAGQLRSDVADYLGVPAGIPVVEAGIDSISAMLAMGVTGDGPAALITGSSNVILAQSSTSVRAKGVWGGYRDAALPGYELVVGLHTAGAAITWLTRDLLGGQIDLQELEAAAREIAPGSDGLIAMPDFQGNRTPFTEPRARGAVWGINFGHRPAHLYRAMLEGIGFATRHALESIVAAGVSISELRACGGATRSPLTMQIYADILDRPIYTTETADASALGAAIAAAIGIGFHPDFTVASGAMNRTGPTFAPNPANRERYDRHYGLFQRTYPALLPLMREMADLT